MTLYNLDCLDFFGIVTLTKPIDLIYIDPPFNTGKTQEIHGKSYTDSYGAGYVDWLMERITPMYHALANAGSILVHLDYREVHYVKVAMDALFGRDNFRNEIIWAYDYGGRPKNCWPKKHDTILWYSKSNNYVFSLDACDRIPYMAPGLVGAEKAERGKTPTDVMWNTIVPTNGSERVGYPTQKPLSLIERLLLVHSNPGDLVADFFHGSGTFLVAAKRNGRNYIGTDISPDAFDTAHMRLDRGY